MTLEPRVRSGVTTACRSGRFAPWVTPNRCLQPEAAGAILSLGPVADFSINMRHLDACNESSASQFAWTQAMASRLWTLPLVLLLTASAQDTGPAVIPIGAVQGPGTESPLVGKVVAVEGVVVGGTVDGLGGVFVQNAGGDGDARTSDGIFVELPPGTSSPRRLERVRVVGTVAEIGEGTSTLTALRPVQLRSLGGRATIQPLALDGPPADGDWERYEGMWLTINAPLTVSSARQLIPLGEITTSFGGRLFAPTELAPPGPSADVVASDNARRRLLLDDGDARELKAVPWFLPAAPNAARPLRAGSVIHGATGVLDERSGEYRLELTASLAGRIEQAPRPLAPSVPGDTRVVAFNVENLFNGDGRGGGFPAARGAQTREQYERQQRKLVATIQALTPDVAGLEEIENDGYGRESTLAQLVAALNHAGPATDYRFVNAGHGPGATPIRVALVYRATRVQPVGDPAVLEGGPFGTHSRVPLAQAFRRGQGPVFVVVVNHLKNKNCGRGGRASATGADADQGDGQSCWNAVRVDSARRIDAWLKIDPTGTHTDLSVLLGDLNAYSQDDPIRLLRRDGWRDAFAEAGVARPYTSIYARTGESECLDHALLSAPLAARLRGAAIWHTNVDELPLFGYLAGGDDSPYRASDHDPVVIGLDLGGRRFSSDQRGAFEERDCAEAGTQREREHRATGEGTARPGRVSGRLVLVPDPVGLRVAERGAVRGDRIRAKDGTGSGRSERGVSGGHVDPDGPVAVGERHGNRSIPNRRPRGKGSGAGRVAAGARRGAGLVASGAGAAPGCGHVARMEADADGHEWLSVCTAGHPGGVNRRSTRTFDGTDNRPRKDLLSRDPHDGPRSLDSLLPVRVRLAYPPARRRNNGV